MRRCFNFRCLLVNIRVEWWLIADILCVATQYRLEGQPRVKFKVGFIDRLSPTVDSL